MPPSLRLRHIFVHITDMRVNIHTCVKYMHSDYLMSWLMYTSICDVVCTFSTFDWNENQVCRSRDYNLHTVHTYVHTHIWYRCYNARIEVYMCVHIYFISYVPPISQSDSDVYTQFLWQDCRTIDHAIEYPRLDLLANFTANVVSEHQIF